MSVRAIGFFSGRVSGGRAAGAPGPQFSQARGAGASGRGCFCFAGDVPGAEGPARPIGAGRVVRVFYVPAGRGSTSSGVARSAAGGAFLAFGARERSGGSGRQTKDELDTGERSRGASRLRDARERRATAPRRLRDRNPARRRANTITRRMDAVPEGQLRALETRAVERIHGPAPAWGARRTGAVPPTVRSGCSRGKTGTYRPAIDGR